MSAGLPAFLLRRRSTAPTRSARQLWAGLALGLLLLAGGASAQGPELRGVWVDAWGSGFLDSSQVTKLVSDCRTYNFNAIFVQMRRRGDAFYNPGNIGNDPKTTAIASSYDALADILSKAHSGSPRLEVHCWVTTWLIWSGATAPSQPGHVVNLHPEYLMQNSAGTNYLAEGCYLDPGHPDAALWNYVMATNIVRRYDLDGFHWDYIRYPQQDAGYNPTAVSRYNAEFGLTGKPSPGDTRFGDWRRRQVTDFARWVNADLLAIRSNLVVSCSVFGNRTDAYNARFQDWAAWNREGLLDLCIPMDYSSDNPTFTARVDDAFNNQGVRRVCPGLGAYLNSKENTLWQLDYVRTKPLTGSLYYSYRTPNSGTVDQAGTFSYLKANYQPAWTGTPALPWKASPTAGIIRGTVTRADTGAALYNATVRLFTPAARALQTEPHGKYAFFEMPPGTYTITATASGLGTVTNTVTITAGANIAANLVIPALDNTAPVISSLACGNISESSATISWTTDEPANSTVDYGPTTSYGSVVGNETQTVIHHVTLVGLTPNTTYHYRVRSRNAVDLQAQSADAIFTTNPAGVVNDIIIDDAAATTVGAWQTGSYSGYYGSGYHFKGPGDGSSYVEFRPNILTAGNYQVYAWYVQGSNRTQDAPYVVSSTSAPQTIRVNQQSNGAQWWPLGTFYLAAGTSGYVRVTDAFATGSVVMADAVKFVYVPPAVPPIIASQPQGGSANQGDIVAFAVTATGTAPLSYRWYFEGTPLPGGTASSYTLYGVQGANEGNYTVVITNVAGSVTSAPAFLEVNVPPVIAAHPQNQTVYRGASVEFSVTAEGSDPLWYQWRFNGNLVSGATSSACVLTNVQSAQAGSYSVIVSNVAGVVISLNAALTVLEPDPPQFQLIEFLPAGGLHLRATGSPGLYSLEASTNLVDWAELTNFVTGTNSFECFDSATNAPRRFYRARWMSGQ